MQNSHAALYWYLSCATEESLANPYADSMITTDSAVVI